MSAKAPAVIASGLVILAAALRAPGEEKAKVNYKDHVAGIFQSKCNACHNGDKKKGGLALDSYTGVMQGGGSGAVVEPGDPDNSRLYLLVSHQEEPKMPPNAPRIPDADLAAIKAWIEAGAPETSGSTVAMKAKPKLDFKLDPAAMGKPQGPPAMPEGVLTEPVVVSARPNAITALAASPWAPLVAIAGHKQVLLYNSQTRHLCGVLPFPEGVIYSLRFSRDGGMLLAAGGRGAERGLAVAFDVKTGNRLFEVGKEYDVALSADISPDRTMVALGGPGKVLRVYGTADGELIYECKKHTDWVTAVEFSPDGVLLASGDRNGGLLVWEAGTGREFYDLRNHNAMITDVSWRLDSNVLASSSEDGTIRLWEMENGGNIKGWGAHGGGASSVRFAKDGRLVSTGRDRAAKLWDQNGGGLRTFDAFNDLALRAAFTFDDAAIVAGDWSGEVRLYATQDGQRLGNLPANPAPIAARLEQARASWNAAQAQADAASKELAALQADAAAKVQAHEAAIQALAAAEQAATEAARRLAEAEADYNRTAGPAEQAAAALWSARNVEARTAAIRASAEAARSAAQEAEKAAHAVQAATGSDRDRLLAEKAQAASQAAHRAFEAASQAAQAAADAAKQAQSVADEKAAQRAAAAQPLPGLRQAVQQSAAARDAARTRREAAQAARAGAEKAVAEKTPAVQALADQAASWKTEVDLLGAELQALAASRPPSTASTARP
jgi:hypothetical protein